MSPEGERYLPLDSRTSQGPRAFVVNPLLVISACVGRHSPLLTRSPRSHLVPRCRLQRVPPVLLSLRDLQSIRRTLTGRPHGLPCGHFGGQLSPVATPDARPPGKGCDEWKEAKGNLVLLTRVSGSVESLFTRTFTWWDILWPSARLAGVSSDSHSA